MGSACTKGRAWRTWAARAQLLPLWREGVLTCPCVNAAALEPCSGLQRSKRGGGLTFSHPAWECPWAADFLQSCRRSFAFRNTAGAEAWLLWEGASEFITLSSDGEELVLWKADFAREVQKVAWSIFVSLSPCFSHLRFAAIWLENSRLCCLLLLLGRHQCAALLIL